MLDSNLLPISVEGKISIKRIEEIFSIPQTRLLWEKIKNHKNYIRIFYPKVDTNKTPWYKNSAAREMADIINQLSIVSKAMLLCATRNLTFEEAIQEQEKLFLKELETVSPDDVRKLSTVAQTGVKILLEKK